MSAARPFHKEDGRVVKEDRRGAREDGRGVAASGAGRLSGRLRRALVYAWAAALIFLAGLVPMWLRARASEGRLDAARRELRLSMLENSLASAALDARRGDYEPARRQASDFFTALRAQADAAEDSALTPEQRQALAPLLDERDDTITLLARNDPASADRLADMYVAFRSQLGRTARAEER